MGPPQPSLALGMTEYFGGLDRTGELKYYQVDSGVAASTHISTLTIPTLTAV